MNIAQIDILGIPIVKIKFIYKKIRIGKKWKLKLCGCKEFSEDFKRFLEKEKKLKKVEE